MPAVSQEEAVRFRLMYDARMSMKQISEQTGRGLETIWRHLRASGATRTLEAGWAMAMDEGRVPAPPVNRRHTFDQRFFEVVDSSEKAWVLGLMFGDGNVRSSGRVLLACGKDKDVARKVADLFSYSGPLVFKSSCWMLEVGSVAMVRDLAALGVVPAKTYTMKFPSLPDGLLPHFVRGLWESDGTMSRLKTGGLYMKYVSASRCFVVSLRDLLIDTVNVVAKVQDPRGLDRRGVPDRTSVISYGSSSAERLSEWVYGSSTKQMRCDRKWHIHRGDV